MTADPTNAEIGRGLEQLARDVRDGFEKINLRLDKYVLGEVHALYVNQTDRRFAEMSARLEAVETNRVTSARWALTTVIAVLALIATVVVGVIAILI